MHRAELAAVQRDAEVIPFVLSPGVLRPEHESAVTSLLYVLYNEIYKKVQSDIEVNAQYVALTTDA